MRTLLPGSCRCHRGAEEPHGLFLMLLHLTVGRPCQLFHQLSPFVSQVPYLHMQLEKERISQKSVCAALVPVGSIQ